MDRSARAPPATRGQSDRCGLGGPGGGLHVHKQKRSCRRRAGQYRGGFSNRPCLIHWEPGAQRRSDSGPE